MTKRGHFLGYIPQILIIPNMVLVTMAEKGGTDNRTKNLIKYRKYNFIIGFIMLIYPLIRYFFDPILGVQGEMKFFQFVMLTGIGGFLISVGQGDKKCIPSSKKVFLGLAILFIFEIFLSMFMVVYYG